MAREGPADLSAAERAGERAAKNTIVRLVAEVVGKLASLVLFAALARSAGETGLGVFVFAFAFVQIAITPVGLGFDRYLLRRVAKDRESVHELFFNVLALKLTLAVPVVALSFLLVSVLGYDATTRATVYLLTGGLLADLLAKTIFYTFNAFERGELLAVSLVVQRVSAAALGLVALAAGYGVVTVAGTYTVGALAGLALALVLFHRRIGLPRSEVARARWRGITRASLPFATQDLFGVVLSKIDVVILSLLATEAAVGRYGAAYRLFEATFFITSALTGAFNAMYTYLDRDSEPSIQATYARSLKLSLAALVPCAVAFGLLAEPISTLFFGIDFADAATPLQLLAAVVVLYGLLTLSSSLIVSRRDPRIVVALVGGMAALNIALNVVLIPALDDAGAALAMLVTDGIFVVAFLAIAARTVGAVRWGPTFASPAAAGAVMAGVIIALQGAPLGLSLVVGAAVYLTAFVLLERAFNPVDLQFVTGMVRRWLPSRAAG